MIIDVSDILKEVGASKELLEETALENFDYQGEILHFDGPLNVKGTISNLEDFLLLSAQISGKVQLVCGKCTDVYEFPLQFHIEVKLQKGSESDDPDIFTYEGEKVELDDIIIEHLLLELPIERRCRQDCKGLCPHCGTNLNKAECQCQWEEEQEKDQKGEIDERMAVLKDFFSTHDKEV